MVVLTRSEKIQTAVARVALRLPARVLRLFTGPAISLDGRVLDAQAQFAMKAHKLSGGLPTHKLSLAEARREIDVSGGQLAPSARTLASVEDRTIAGMRMRIYRARGTPSYGPALLFFHGGGHAIGSLDSHDAVCRETAVATPCTVISVEYRLAPEHPFPAAADDATAAFRGVVADATALLVDRNRIAIGGDSAGGNLAAVVALDTRNDAIRPCYQLLIYPVVDLTMSFPSVQTFGSGFFLEKESIVWFRSKYLGDHDPKDPRVSPWFAKSLAGLPPALVMTAGFDPLRDEGDAYAKRLADAGVAVEHRSYEGLFHGFWNTTGVIRAATRAFDETIVSLRRALRAPE